MEAVTGDRRAYGAYGALGVGLALALIYALAIDTGAATEIYVLTGLYATTLSVVGAARMPRAHRRIWWAFAAAQLLFLVADLIWILFENVLDIAPFPSVADAVYLCQYPALALGLLWLVRGRRRGRDRAAFLDAAILVTGVTVVGTVFFIAPAAETGGSDLLDQVVAAAYPAGDLLVLALVVRLFTAGVAKNLSLWALCGGIAALLVADLTYVVTVVNGQPYPLWIDVAFLVSYLLLAFAVLHPSAHQLSEPLPERPEQMTVVRLVLLGGALVLAPLTGQLADLVGRGYDGSWVVLVGGCVAAVLVVLRLGDLLGSLQRQAVQLAALARRDPLTGVPNRRTWDHELSRACAVARDEDSTVTAAVLDMDHFKQFNDAFGHLRGDLVLKETAAAWSAILDGRGFLARFGGEEFTVLVPGLPTEEAVVLLDQMRCAVSHRQTCSIGVATWDGVETPGELVARADRALYQAKRAGRDRIAVDDGRSASVVVRAEDPVIASLRSVYQPIVDLRNGEVIGREALTRFEGANPRDVFDRAARDGTAGRVEAAAIRSAIAGWDGRGLLSLNASPGAILTGEIEQAMPDELVGIIVEITEADLSGFSAELMLVIADLRAKGALIAIDDFGTGFSNVARVATLHPDVIKLDMSLIRGIDTAPALRAVVAATLLFAEQTDAQVIAEGIETPAERDCLVELGVRFGQGFLLGAPEPAVVTR